MSEAPPSRPRFDGWRLPAGCCLVALILLALTVANAAPPTFMHQSEATNIALWADRAWTLFPGDCVTVQWQLEGIESVYIAGEGVIGWGEMPFCPDINATEIPFTITAQGGLVHGYSLRIHHLPDLLFYLCGFVGLLGSILLGGYLFATHCVKRPLPWAWLVIGALLLGGLGTWQRLQTASTPLVAEASGELALRFWADQDRILFPHECVNIAWSVVGAEAIRVNGQDVTERGNPARGRHCAEDGQLARLEASDGAGISASVALHIPVLLPQLADAPAFIYLSLIGIALGLAVYTPLVAELARESWRARSRPDQVALLACFGFVLLLYLPFGFASPGHWEEWIIRGYAEGGTLSFYRAETVSRPVVTLPHTLAMLISPESFVGYQLVNFFLYALEMTLLYGILRKLGIVPLYAFMMAVCFLAYPVNDALMTTRRLPKNFSLMTMLLAVFFVLDYCKRPRRLTLLGVWLALMYSVNTNETGFAVILIAPLLWWLRDRRWSARNLNLTAIWVLAPAFKVGFVVLLLAGGRDFYQSGLLQASTDAGAPSPSAIEIAAQVMRRVFQETFLDGWLGALATLEHNSHWLATALMLALVGAVAFYLSRATTAAEAPPRQWFHTLLGGLLVIAASVGILMWIPLYREDIWRMYVVVPVGAAVALISFIALCASRIRPLGARQFAVVAVCMLLLMPAASRLIQQLDYFTRSAQAKARILHQVVSLAPAVAPGTQIALITDMSNAELGEKGIFELLNNDMLNSALYVLYQGAGPEVAYFCAERSKCGVFSGDETLFEAADPAQLLRRTLVVLLREDLSVELIRDPKAFLRFTGDINYEADGLYDAFAPPPPRLATMLGPALD